MHFSLSFICYLPLNAKHSQTRCGKQLRLQSALFWVSVPTATNISQNRTERRQNPHQKLNFHPGIILSLWTESAFKGNPLKEPTEPYSAACRNTSKGRYKGSLPACLACLFFGLVSDPVTL